MRGCCCHSRRAHLWRQRGAEGRDEGLGGGVECAEGAGDGGSCGRGVHEAALEALLQLQAEQVEGLGEGFCRTPPRGRWQRRPLPRCSRASLRRGVAIRMPLPPRTARHVLQEVVRDLHRARRVALQVLQVLV
jgi:hypothetical protein